MYTIEDVSRVARAVAHDTVKFMSEDGYAPESTFTEAIDGAMSVVSVMLTPTLHKLKSDYEQMKSMNVSDSMLEVARKMIAEEESRIEVGVAQPTQTPEPKFKWQPISTLTDEYKTTRKMFVVIAINVEMGFPEYLYTTDPYCVWTEVSTPDPFTELVKFARWPHKDFHPTHWMPLPSTKI